jgi:hypothetical protein
LCLPRKGTRPLSFSFALDALNPECSLSPSPPAHLGATAAHSIWQLEETCAAADRGSITAPRAALFAGYLGVRRPAISKQGTTPGESDAGTGKSRKTLQTRDVRVSRRFQAWSKPWRCCCSEARPHSFSSSSLRFSHRVSSAILDPHISNAYPSRSLCIRSRILTISTSLAPVGLTLAIFGSSIATVTAPPTASYLSGTAGSRSFDHLQMLTSPDLVDAS